MSNHVISDIVHHVQGLHLSEFAQFEVQIFKEAKKVFLRLCVINGRSGNAERRCLQFGLTDGMAIKVLDEECGRKGGTVVKATAPIGMTTGANFKVKWTIHLVFFRAVNASQMLRHCLFFVDSQAAAAVVRALLVLVD
jgi:Fe2+ transport system protein FeoA